MLLNSIKIWQCVMMLILMSVIHWFYCLLLCTDTVVYYYSLILFSIIMHWYYCLLLCTDVIVYYCTLILLSIIMHWCYCLLLYTDTVVYYYAITIDILILWLTVVIWREKSVCKADHKKHTVTHAELQLLNSSNLHLVSELNKDEFHRAVRKEDGVDYHDDHDD